MGKCVYKKKRKGTRACPALDGDICSRCCGRHRLVDIDWPYDCRWLRKGLKEHRIRFLESSATRELSLPRWLNEDVLSDAAGPPGGGMGVDFILRVLEVIHWELKQKNDPEAFRDVVEDAVRYVKQTRTGNVVSPEEAPSSLADTLEKFLSRFVPERESDERHERFIKRVLDNVESAIDWCEKRDVSFFDFLDEFFSEYNLPGWEPVKEKGDRLVIPEDTYGDGEEPAPGEPDREEGEDDSDLIIPGR